MATLEKIRSKSVFLIVIIAVALLAFILGDAITNGRNLFGNGTTVAEVDGQKIDLADYQRKHQELTQRVEEMRRQNPAQAAQMDNQAISQQALDELITETLINKAVDKTGIRVSPELLRFYMIESPQMLPELQNLLQSMNQNGLNVQSPEQAYSIIFNPQSVGLTEQMVAPFQRAWINVENVYRGKIAQVIYMGLVQQSSKANALDIAAMKRDYTATANVKVAKKAYGVVDEKKYPVSDDDIKKAYEAKKNNFKVEEPTKEVSMIALKVSPSDKDKAAANKLAHDAVTQLKKNGQLSKDLQKEGLALERHTMRTADVKNPQLKSFVEVASADSVGMLQTNMNGFMVVKMGNRTAELDSIEISTISVVGKNLPAKVLAAVEGGLSVDSLQTQFSQDSVMYQAPQWLPLFTADGKTPISNYGLTQEQMNTLVASNGNFVTLHESDDVTVYAKVTDRKSEKPVVSYETIEYVIHPSETTIAQEQARLQKFLDANKDVAKFANNAKAQGFNVQNVTLTPSTPAVPQGFNSYYPDSRPVVRWVVMDSKKGDVSKIYMSKDPETPMLYAVAVVDAYEDFTPWTNEDVKNQLTKEVRNSKYGDDLVKEYSAKGNIDQIAEAMGVEVSEVADLKAQRNPNVSDPAVLGRIMGSKPNQKAQVIKGEDGVYAVVVNSVGNEGNQMTDEQFGQMFLQMHQSNPVNKVRGTKKVKNNIYKFEAGE